MFFTSSIISFKDRQSFFYAELLLNHCMHPTHCIHKYSSTKSHSKNNYLQPYSNNSLKVLKCIIAYELLYTKICKCRYAAVCAVHLEAPIFVLSHS